MVGIYVFHVPVWRLSVDLQLSWQLDCNWYRSYDSCGRNISDSKIKTIGVPSRNAKVERKHVANRPTVLIVSSILDNILAPDIKERLDSKSARLLSSLATKGDIGK